jgi:hypothetical protein
VTTWTTTSTTHLEMNLHRQITRLHRSALALLAAAVAEVAEAAEAAEGTVAVEATAPAIRSAPH